MAEEPRLVSFRWEWNINTVAVIAGFVAGFVAWGYTLAALQEGREQATLNISRLTTEGQATVARIDLIERTLVKLEQTEYRMAQIEKANDNLDQRISRITESYAQQFAEFRAQLSAISTQIALTNQTLSRMERGVKPEG